ncbi:MAG: hypothetical protein U0Y08_01980 [Bacteroidia bacterium]
MKKSIALLAFVLSGGCLMAQNPIKNKDGVVLTPEPGEFALNIDAVPFLKYAGSLFNDQSDAPYASFGSNYPLTFTGLYMKKENFAYRAKVKLGFGVQKADSLVARIGSTNPNETVANETKLSTSNITLGAGIQKWRGKTRVQAYYGGEVLFSIGTEKTSYTYGNPLSSENQATRLKSEKPGNTFGFMLRGFVGIEYFFSPKVSLGAEFGWGPSILSTGQGETQSESWNGSGTEVTITNTGKSSEFVMDNDNSSGAINLSFYF